MTNEEWMGRWQRWMRRGGSALALVGLVACLPADGEEPIEEAPAPAPAEGVRTVNVEVTPVSRSTFNDFVRVTGEVEAWQDVTLSAEEAGRVARFYVTKGRSVNQGSPILKIDDQVLQSQVDEAAALARLAEEQYNRQRRLWEDDGVGSEIVFLQARSAWEAAEARLRTLQTRLDRTVIRAPVAGVFDENFVEVGEMVSPGTPVVRVVASQRVKIAGGVPERFALAIDEGDSAWVDLDVLPGLEFVGRIGFVGASVDARSRTIPVEIELDNADGVLRPHMVANVRIARDRFDDVVVVSQEVVIRTEDGYQVFVVENDGDVATAQARSVELGPSFADRVVIVDGLFDGDLLITVGHRLVDEGSRVRIVNAPESGS